MRVILAGGGTGGHIYPAVAIAEKIKRKQPDSELLFIGTENGMEKELVPAAGYPIRFIRVRGFNRKNLLKNVGVLMDLAKGRQQARAILRDFRPDAVVGTGGYVSGPVIQEAHRLGVPAFLHEQNAFPGLSNKLAEKYADRLFLAFEEGTAHFRNPDKIVVTGNPIRREFLTAGIAGHRQRMGIGNGEFVVLCFGGSRGAQKINEAMTGILEAIHQAGGMRLYFITGRPYYRDILREMSRKNLPTEGPLHLLAYSDRIHELFAAADLIISRSGALTVSEITACGKASILVPSPNVTGNHQLFNAKTVADRGGALLIEEQDLTGDKLLDAVLRLKNNKKLLNDMSAVSRRLGRVDAADVIYDHICAGVCHDR